MAASIEIIGTESLGVRGLCCLIKTAKRRIVIDPGLALGYIRHGLLPHPLQVAEGERVRRRIILALAKATDVVFSHFHGDHIPLREANPYQLAIRDLPENMQKICCWGKSSDSLKEKMKQRARDLQALLGPNFHLVEGLTIGPMTFSKAVPHGKAKGVSRGSGGSVMMTRINVGEKVFVHASDIQLLDTSTIDLIISWQPNIVLAAGPPLYMKMLSDKLRKTAWENGLTLASNVDVLILDHHLMRDNQGPAWLEALSAEAGKQVYCAADFLGRQRLLLEAKRAESYETMVVPAGWHENYAKGEINAEKWLHCLPASTL
jgi:predicted metallo-beta-lactamase superfamily hydrolase